MLKQVQNTEFDVIVIGAGAAGIMAAIVAAEKEKRVLLLEKLPQVAAKLKATGGGRCNLTNTLSKEAFMERFGKNGRFMQDVLNAFSHQDLINFFEDIGVQTHAPDGYRVFPKSHNSTTIIEALKNRLSHLNVCLKTSQKVEEILTDEDGVRGVRTQTTSFLAPHVVVATGGLGYPSLGSEGDGYTLAQELGHKCTPIFPAMMPLFTKENFASCTADTMAKVELRVDMKKHKKLQAKGDLIFTKKGIRGPVVLDFAREITPLLDKYGEVPVLANFTKGMSENAILEHFKKQALNNTQSSVLELVCTLLPKALAKELCHLCAIEENTSWSKLQGVLKERLMKTLAWTPFTITGHEGFKKAMITRGGISLKEIEPKTMRSKLKKGLYFCGEVVDIDGPCGGYNLQWSFSSGFIAGQLL